LQGTQGPTHNANLEQECASLSPNVSPKALCLTKDIAACLAQS